MLSPTSTIEILLSDSRGIYIPRDFYNDCNLPAWGLDREKYTTLESPDNDWYWEAWEDLINAAKWTDPNTGHTWGLFQDGDLFMYRDDHEFEGGDDV